MSMACKHKDGFACPPHRPLSRNKTLAEWLLGTSARAFHPQPGLDLTHTSSPPVPTHRPRPSEAGNDDAARPVFGGLPAAPLLHLVPALPRSLLEPRQPISLTTGKLLTRPTWLAASACAEKGGPCTAYAYKWSLPQDCAVRKAVLPFLCVCDNMGHGLPPI